MGEAVHLSKPVIQDVTDEYVHVLSHQKLFVRFYHIISKNKISPIPEGCFWIKIKDFEKYAVPKPIDIYIRKNVLK